MRIVFTIMPMIGMAGCAVPYAYPKVDRTKSVELGETAKGVTAFRVDYTAEGSDEWERKASLYRVALLDVDPKHSEIPSQARVGLERGLFLYMVDLTHDQHVEQAVEVRLYRRGYKTMVINHGYQGGPLTWTQAASMPERECAIDAMFWPHVAGIKAAEDADAPAIPTDTSEVFRFVILPILTAEPFRKACVFGRQEYEELLKTKNLAKPDRERIEAKAAHLKKLIKG